ncbi:Core-2/I-Branching enzyme [Necator americanus]|uniref:Core-2/I-Branching enzyme n=1 Tax=Necator americanus TaxID=51031 RepID=W2TWN3_NECAM|nr:Core-2/I-Branching enzyme [Necator americanus]ETN86084.1 Core-2/I-Branching enzyme [Necator americanus]
MERDCNEGEIHVTSEQAEVLIIADSTELSYETGFNLRYIQDSGQPLPKPPPSVWVPGSENRGFRGSTAVGGPIEKFILNAIPKVRDPNRPWESIASIVAEYSLASLLGVTLRYPSGSLYFPPMRLLLSRCQADLLGRCPWIRNLFGFDCKPTSKAERKFPLAYGLLVYTNAIQVLFMLSAFYRPQNEYCIAVSGSASKDFKFLMKVVDECFDNVYVMERPPVKWGSFEILNSTFACLEVLSHSDRPWRYYQYLSGFDVPLKTNREMIEIFKMWNNTVNARYMRYEKHRLNQKREEDSPLPIIKASVSAALPRSAVDKIVKSKETRKLLKFLQGTTIPDESFWGTLTGNTDISFSFTYFF